MKIEDIVDILNKYIEDKRRDNSILTSGHLVLQRIVTSHPTFKAYKSYELLLWFVKDRKKYKVLTIKEIAKVIDGQEDRIIRNISMQFCYLIFNLLNTDTYNEILTGIYKGKEE